MITSWAVSDRRSLHQVAVAVGVIATFVLTGVVVATTSQSVLALIGAAAAVILVAFVSAISPRAAVLLVFAVSTLSGLTLPTPIGVLRLDQAIVLPALGGVLVRRALDRDRTTARVDRTPLLLAGCLGLYVLINLGSTMVSALDVASSLRVVLWLSLSFAAYLTTIVATPRYVSVGRLLNDVVVIGTVAAAGAVLTYVVAGLGIASFGVQTDAPSGQLSAKGAFWEANLLGSFAAMTTVLAASQLLHVRGAQSRHRTMLLLSLSICVAATYLSFTRAAWLGLVAGGAVLLLASRPASGRGKVVLQGGLAIAAGGALLALSGGGATFVDRVMSLFTDDTGTIAYRSANVGLALGGIQDHLLLGLGTNSFGQHNLDPTQDYSRGYIGGLLIATLWDVGIVGIGVLLLAFATLARRLSIGLASTDDDARTQAVGLCAALLCALVAYQATSGFWFAYNWVLMGLAVSIPIGLAVAKPGQKSGLEGAGSQRQRSLPEQRDW